MDGEFRFCSYCGKEIVQCLDYPAGEYPVDWEGMNHSMRDVSVDLEGVSLPLREPVRLMAKVLWLLVRKVQEMDG